MPAHGQAKLVNIHLVREVCPMPAHIVLIIRREYALVKILKGGFEPRWARPLQDHRSLLRENRRDRPRTGTARGPQVYRRLSPGCSDNKAKPPTVAAPSKRRRVMCRPSTS